MQSFTLPSPAKINSFLHVVGRRSDGYHLLQTAFQFLEFGDVISVTLREDEQVNFSSNLTTVPVEDNLIIKATNAFFQKTKCSFGLDIHLEKQIPLGSGLGGGSSNAATMLLTLNHLTDRELTHTELQQLGLQLGADIPIFLHGFASFAEGVGERFHDIDVEERWLLLIFPGCEVETRKIFSDPELTRTTPMITIREFQRQAKTRNDCEMITKKHYPLVGQALDWLNQFAPARMTGTGSTVFATFDTKAAAEELAEKIPTPFSGIVTKSLNVSPLHWLFFKG